MNYRRLILNVREQTAEQGYFFFFLIKSKLQEDLKFNHVAWRKSFCNQRVKENRGSYIFTDSLTVIMLYLLIIIRTADGLNLNAMLFQNFHLCWPSKDALVIITMFCIFYCNFNANKYLVCKMSFPLLMHASAV